jgi:hypothetical protein
MVRQSDFLLIFFLCIFRDPVLFGDTNLALLYVPMI